MWVAMVTLAIVATGVVGFWTGACWAGLRADEEIRDAAERAGATGRAPSYQIDPGMPGEGVKRVKP